jgi:potassium/chloride transporter 9
VILAGEAATSLFSVLMGVIGSAKLLQALARDRLVPGLSVFGKGSRATDEPFYAIFLTYILAQLTMFADINQIASFITMTVSRVSDPGKWVEALPGVFKY